MRIVVAADHAGYPLKAAVVAELRASGHEVADLGTDDPSKPSDYPEVAERVCEAVRRELEARGVPFLDFGGSQLWVRDPDGNVVELSEARPG